MLRKTSLAAAIAATLAISSVFADESVTGTVQQFHDGKVVKTLHTYQTGTMPTLTTTASHASVPVEYADLQSEGIAKFSVDKDMFVNAKPGEKIVTEMFGKSFEFTAEEHIKHDNGDISWVGFANGERSIITFGNDGSVIGTINSHDGNYTIDTADNGEAWAIDHNAAGVTYPEVGEDAHVQHSLGANVAVKVNGTVVNATTAKAQTEAVAKALSAEEIAATYGVNSSTTKTVLDLYVMHDPDVKNAATRINTLVALTNTVYRDSGLINLSVRVVGSKMVNFDEVTVNNTTILNSMTTNSNSFAGSTNEKIKMGADITVYLRPFKKTQGSCGVAWLNGANGAALSSKNTYAVVSDGYDGTAYCATTTFAHEIGHTLGAAHDKANSGSVKGAFPYAYGYGASNLYGDVMSYYSPQVPKFSSPQILVKTVGSTAYYLGETDTADVVRTFLKTAPVVAKFGENFK